MKKLKMPKRPWAIYKGGNFVHIFEADKIATHTICSRKEGCIATINMDFKDDVKDVLPRARLIVKAVNRDREFNALVRIVETVLDREFSLDSESRNYHDEHLNRWWRTVVRAKKGSRP